MDNVVTGGWPNSSAPIAEVPAETPQQFETRRNAEINGWLAAKKTADAAVEAERTLRATVTATLFPTPAKGTQRYELGGGYKVKLVHGLTYTLGDKDKLDDSGLKVKVRRQIEELEAAIVAKYPVEGPLILDRLISWKPELSGSEYENTDGSNAIAVDIRDMISEVLTIKPASPQLAFEEPKAK